jgi:succinate dehydrogenase flavin-adding protein (antitoxin of CptAB toxin-antitoxin module)
MSDTESFMMNSAAELNIAVEEPGVVDVDFGDLPPLDAEEVAPATEGEEIEASGEAGEEENKQEASGSTEGEENKATEMEAAPTPKELQEIAAAREAFEAEKKAFQDEMTNLKKEFEAHSEKVKVHDELDAFLSNLAGKDPELFDLIKAEFQEHQKQYSNPVLDQFRKEHQELAKSVNEIKQKFSDEVTRTKLDAEMNQVKTTVGKEAEEAGVKVDWNKVEDFWADNPKTDLKGAVYALYGEAIAKASASKAKVSQVEKKVAARPQVATAGAIKGTTSKPQVDFSKMSVGELVRYYARQATH